jgi:hypothetical protein
MKCVYIYQELMLVSKGLVMFVDAEKPKNYNRIGFSSIGLKMNVLVGFPLNVFNEKLY